MSHLRPRLASLSEISPALTHVSGVAPIELTAGTAAYWRGELGLAAGPGSVVWRVGAGRYVVALPYGPGEDIPLRIVLVAVEGGARRTLAEGHAAVLGDAPCLLEVSGGVVLLPGGDRMR